MLISISFPFFYIKRLFCQLWSRSDILFSLCVAEIAPPPLVKDIHDWVGRVLVHTAGIREWPAFLKKLGPAPSMTGKFTHLHLYCYDLLVACLLLSHRER